VPPDPSCSALVVRSPPRRFAPRAGFQAVAPGTGMTSLVSTSPARRPSHRLPDEMHGEGGARFSRSVAFTPLEEPASRTLARSGCEPWTRRTASPRPLPPCRFHDFEAFLGSERPVRTVRPCGHSGRTLSFHGLCSPSRSSFRPRPQPCTDFTASARSADHPTARAASVRSRCCRPLPDSDLPGVFDVKDRSSFHPFRGFRSGAFSVAHLEVSGLSVPNFNHQRMPSGDHIRY
jgi:hypothetical protein